MELFVQLEQSVYLLQMLRFLWEGLLGSGHVQFRDLILIFQLNL